MTDKQLIKFVSQFRKGILGRRGPQRMCDAVCMPLVPYMGLMGIDANLIAGEIKDDVNGWWGHYWIELSDGRIIDPTASQFKTPTGEDMPEIYLGEKPKWYNNHQTN